MDKINNFFVKNQSIILIILFLFIYLKQCSIDRIILKMKKDHLQLNYKIDSLKKIIDYKLITKIDLQIEGLKAEKRMIQSVDRKLLDVNRQNEIDKEIKELEKELEKNKIK